MKPVTQKTIESPMPPEGSIPASGSGARSRADNQTPTDIPHSSAVREAKEGVKLQRLMKKWENKAAWFNSEEKFFRPEDTCPIINAYRRTAAVYRECIRDLVAVSGAQPLTQSEWNEGEPCPHCYEPLEQVDIKDGTCWLCMEKLPGTRGAGEERAGLPNAEPTDR